MKLIGKKKLVEATFNLDYQTFVIYIANLNMSFDISDKVNFLKKTLIVHLKQIKLLQKFLISILILQIFFYQSWL